MTKSREWDEKRARQFVRPVARSSSAESPHAALARRITADWAPGNGQYVFLDVGTGPGRLPIEVKTLCPHARVIGMDPLEFMVSLAQKNAEAAGFTDIEIVAGSAEQIPLDSETANLIVAQRSLLFWNNPKRGLSEVYRVLKPDGKIVILDWNKSYPKWKFYLHNLNVIRRAGWHRAQDIRKSFRYAYPFKRVLQMMRAANFEPVETEGEKELSFFIKAIKTKIR